ncbi:sensor histidine kinase [Halalkalibaculum sp. DA3122]|uniref:sensor histidine kinase n=1 Tax=Halalkalibaculum sp. DA3122 TaxID=3373607 RepID=UPI003754FEF1
MSAREHQAGSDHYTWQPVPLDFLLSSYSAFNFRVLAILSTWTLCIAFTLAATIYLLPENRMVIGTESTEVIKFFLFNPALILGLLLFFWFGFEWGFIPVFLSSFIIAFHSSMAWGWALLFGISFVLGMSIMAMAYQSFKISYNLRSLKSIAFFISISFIASIGSSLGAFIWSLSHHLSALDTLIVWKGWWSGSFLQSALFIGPLLFFFTPVAEHLKHRWLKIPEQQPISLRWVYGAVISVTIVLVIFILSGKILGELRVQEVMTGAQRITLTSVMGALESFEIISWISMGLIIVTGYGAIYLISGWNRKLNREVNKRTAELSESQEKLRKSLNEKEFLLKEIHHRVKNNLALVSALLELQEMTSGAGQNPELLQTSRSRIKSMALAHEALYQNENFSDINIRNFIERIADLTHKSFAPKDGSIRLHLHLEDARLNMKRSISLGLLLNEIMINAYKHAFKGQQQGTILLQSKTVGGKVLLEISDDGVGLPEDTGMDSQKSLGMSLIKKMAKQLSGKLDISSSQEGTTFRLSFDEED